MKTASIFAFIAIAMSLLAFQNCGSSGSSSGGTTSALGSGTLVISPLAPSVAEGADVPFIVSGGTAPYTYAVTSGSGYFSGSYFIAPAVAETDTITITDSVGYVISTTVSVTTSTTTSSLISCIGSYNVTAGGNSGSLVISAQDTSGNITAGYMTVRSINGTITSGSCVYTGSSYEITFTRTYSGQYQIYTGTMTDTGVSTYEWYMSGTYQTCSTSGSCDAGTNTWSASYLN